MKWSNALMRQKVDIDLLLSRTFLLIENVSSQAISTIYDSTYEYGKEMRWEFLRLVCFAQLFMNHKRRIKFLSKAREADV